MQTHFAITKRCALTELKLGCVTITPAETGLYINDWCLHCTHNIIMGNEDNFTNCLCIRIVRAIAGDQICVYMWTFVQINLLRHFVTSFSLLSLVISFSSSLDTSPDKFTQKQMRCVFNQLTPVANFIIQYVNVLRKTSRDPHRTNQRGGMTTNCVLRGTFVCRVRFVEGLQHPSYNYMLLLHVSHIPNILFIGYLPKKQFYRVVTQKVRFGRLFVIFAIIFN